MENEILNIRDSAKDMVIIFFGELSTKGKNIFDFIKKLGVNIKAKLKKFDKLQYEIKKDHIYIILNGTPYEDVAKGLKQVPGILNFSLAMGIEKDLDEFKKYSLELAKSSNAKTFKVTVKRADKTFPYHSDEICREVGDYVLDNIPSIKVDVHSPELLIHIMIRQELAYVYGPKEKGLGGYPVGIAGKTLQLLSGGIDSPVATFMMMRRGAKVECIHFAAPPYTSEKVIEKIKDLLHVLTDYQPSIKLMIVPFTHLQEEIYKAAGTSYAITIMRRMMLRIATKVAWNNNDIVLSTGESFGQVASQTLKSFVAIDPATPMPIIRPLVAIDKIDIIDIAQKINTFDISVRPYEDCCTIFDVKNPTTCPHPDKIEEIENSFDWKAMVEECARNVQKIYITDEDEDDSNLL